HPLYIPATSSHIRSFRCCPLSLCKFGALLRTDNSGWKFCSSALKKFIRTPEIPSKHVRNWVPKVLEQRRQGLEFYLQSIVLENEELPKMFLDFLNVRHFPSLPKAESCGSFEETESEESSKLSHQPALLFLRDPYILPTANDDFPNVIVEGILHGLFYPHLQPR
uniref:Sorting nexin 24 n=1 Tax=Laticauda laticaudata TaxID=8630 RepID=A0A8C5RZB5_LATLA